MAYPGKSRAVRNWALWRAQVRVDAALDDAEEGLVGARMGGPAAYGPGVRAYERLRDVVPVQGVSAFVERHSDVGPQSFLDVDDAFGREAVGGAVDVAAKGDAVGVELAAVGEAEDLIAAGIGQDRSLPAHEAVQASRTFDQLVAGAEVEMVGIGQHEGGAELGKVARFERLDVGGGAHGGKGRHLHGTVGGVKGGAARGSLSRVNLEGKRSVHFGLRTHRHRKRRETLSHSLCIVNAALGGLRVPGRRKGFSCIRTWRRPGTERVDPALWSGRPDRGSCL